MTRSEVLSKADSYVNGDREQDYGSPESNFQTIADLWAVYLQGCGVAIDFLEPHDVAAMLALLKIARIASGHAKADNWVDLAGYAACGGEIVTVDKPSATHPSHHHRKQALRAIPGWGGVDDGSAKTAQSALSTSKCQTVPALTKDTISNARINT